MPTARILLLGIIVTASFPAAFAQKPRVKPPQTRTIDGVVVDTTGGPRWIGIVIESQGKKYIVSINNSDYPKSDPLVVGDVESKGAKVRVHYLTIEPWLDGMFSVRATKITRVGDSTDSTNPYSDWNKFWTDLRAGARRRDRALLMKLMSTNFEWNCCALWDNNGDGDGRDDAFQNWDDLRVRGWDALNRVLSLGSVPASGRFEQNRGNRRVAPPLSVRHSYRNWFAIFEFSNGRWYFISFVVPGT